MTCTHTPVYTQTLKKLHTPNHLELTNANVNIKAVTHSSRKISTNFPKRLELSFRTVLAFPKDSSRGVASRIWRLSIRVSADFIYNTVKTLNLKTNNKIKSHLNLGG